MARIRSFILIVLIGLVAPIMGMCLNDEPTTKANEFLINKWKMLFKADDINKDGKLSMEDVEKLGNNVFNLEYLDIKKRKIVTEVFTQYWEECLFLGRKGDMSEDEFVDSFKNAFNANPEEFVNHVRICQESIFSAIDINEDKWLSKKELHIGHRAFGHAKLIKDDDNFSAYGPKDGLIPLHVPVDYWVDFFTSTDESKDNVVKSGFDVDGYE